MMNTNNGQTVAKGTKISNHLYRLDDFTIMIPSFQTHVNIQIFSMTKPAKSWDVWHRRFGHLGISSIQMLRIWSPALSSIYKLQNTTVTLVRRQSSMLLLFHLCQLTKPGELIHMNLWEKYPVKSIHSNQYFHTFLNDNTRPPSLHFMKHKDEESQAVKDYVAYLKACGLHPNAFRCDQGTKFLNENLTQWLTEQGVELQTMAPYSPS